MRRWFSTYEDVLHIYFSDYVRSLSPEEAERVSPSSPWRSFKLSLRIIQKRLQQLGKQSPSPEFQLLKGKVWLFVLSKNNLDSLSFLHGQLADSILVADKDRDVYSRYTRCIPTLKFQIFHLYKFPFLMAYLAFKKGWQAIRVAPVILKSIGFVEEWKRVLKETKPRAIIFANDHNVESRSLLLAAKFLKIPTIYLQHASVTSSFPALKFDLNLLEGQDSLDKYSAIKKISSEVRLVGMPKFDQYVSQRGPKRKINSIGLPYNLNDNRQALIDLVRSLRETFPEKNIVVRRHPKDRSNFSISSEIRGVVESAPDQESAFDFLVKQDCIVAGNSSIHLEAALLNIPSVYYNMSQGTFIDDYYGYVRNGLVSSAQSLTELHSFINRFNESPWDVYPRARYFNALVAAPREGESQKIVIEQINDFISR